MFKNMTQHARPLTAMLFSDDIMWHRSVVRALDSAVQMVNSVLPYRGYCKLDYMVPVNYGRDYAAEEAAVQAESDYWDMMEAYDEREAV